MSKLKTPQEKKRASLAHDRRNCYGESPHGARKSIPRNEALRRQAERRAAGQALTQALGRADEDVLGAVQNKALARARRKRLAGFRKCADAPLGEVIERKRRRRLIQAGRKKLAMPKS